MPRATIQTSTDTRETLFLRLRADAPAREVAWREFYERYAPIISGFARRMGAREQDVSDLVQEVMVGFFSACPIFKYDASKGRFRGYLKTCTWRVVRQRLERQPLVYGRCVVDIDQTEAAIDHEWNDIWQTELAHRALEVVRAQYLSHPDRAWTFEAFEACALLERPPEEVARNLGISLDSVHQAKSRISKALRVAMAEISAEIE